jgi:predicted lactoylglutathione lyase
MSKMIFVSLPVTDLKASMAFYEAIGFKNNPQFTDETAACMVWSEAINFMLLTHAKNGAPSQAAPSHQERRAK